MLTVRVLNRDVIIGGIVVPVKAVRIRGNIPNLECVDPPTHYSNPQKVGAWFEDD